MHMETTQSHKRYHYIQENRLETKVCNAPTWKTHAQLYSAMHTEMHNRTKAEEKHTQLGMEASLECPLENNESERSIRRQGATGEGKAPDRNATNTS